uniref:Uncharacterized protein n=1 Tax=Attheya septentrionalis TaxID=420275 RepID=A0A7S2UC28_9STRA|mmetsp:Transcript_17624/g.31817  ORF Transcript_17624/g.31817 Transcript_17624/m.31817 type:complete len:564 (+) Transcript_17624:60-1751(+)
MTMRLRVAQLLAVAVLGVLDGSHTQAFSPAGTRLSLVSQYPSQAQAQAQARQYVNVPDSSNTSSRYKYRLNMIDPTMVSDISSLMGSTSSSSLVSFADQGQNLAGIFFQASLLPYLGFLYFLSFRGNRTPELGNFGWQFLLLFVLSTIPSGLVTKATYGSTLADCDWLHGGAELLLTITNVLIVLGFSNASTGAAGPDKNKLKLFGFGAFGAFCVALALGPNIGFENHSAFLFGLGNLPSETAMSLPWVTHSEPINALSIPTWAIHFSSVYEFLFAMGIIWNFAEVTNNPKWKGLTWGMLPLHASGIAACTYHFFYNDKSLQFLVESQAFLTLLGNLLVAIAAYRIAASNGWTLEELNPFPPSSTSARGLAIDEAAAVPLAISPAKDSGAVLAAKLVGLTAATSYIVKYGELGIDIPFTPNPAIAIAIVAGLPAITAYNFYSKGKEDGGEMGFSFPGTGEGGLSMADVKKYGVSGTVAYVITELAFWAVAFPVASTALYQSTGHWPDVINDTTDRTTVLGFIFAGANVARLLVPIRLGAALALAPWVDDNIINRGKSGEEEES